MPQIFTFTVSDPEACTPARLAGWLPKRRNMNRASPLPTVEDPWMPSVSSVLWDLMFNKVTRLRFGCRATMKLSLLQSSSDSSRSTCNENDTGVGVSAGIAIGTVRVLAAVDYAVERRLIDDPQAEMDRFRAARDTAVAQLKQLRDNVAAEFGENKAELFDAHRLMLQDPDYAECVEGLIAQDKVNAEFAVKSAAEQFAAMFAAMDSSTMQLEPLMSRMFLAA